MGCLFPPPEQREIGCCNDLGQPANSFAVKRGLDHPPLGFPKFSFAHHKAVAEQQGNAFDGLTFWVVLPVLAEYVLCVLGSLTTYTLVP